MDFLNIISGLNVFQQTIKFLSYSTINIKIIYYALNQSGSHSLWSPSLGDIEIDLPFIQFNYSFWSQSSFLAAPSPATSFTFAWAYVAMLAALAMFSADPISLAILEADDIPSFCISPALSETLEMNSLICGEYFLSIGLNTVVYKVLAPCVWGNMRYMKNTNLMIE